MCLSKSLFHWAAVHCSSRLQAGKRVQTAETGTSRSAKCTYVLLWCCWTIPGCQRIKPLNLRLRTLRLRLRALWHKFIHGPGICCAEDSHGSQNERQRHGVAQHRHPQCSGFSALHVTLPKEENGSAEIAETSLGGDSGDDRTNNHPFLKKRWTLCPQRRKNNNC